VSGGGVGGPAAGSSGEPREDDLTEVLRREQALLDPGVRADPDAVLDLLHPEFAEIGASGRLWDGPSVAAAVAHTPRTENDEVAGHVRLGMDEVALHRLGDDTVLLTYRLPDSDRPSRRSSLWLRDVRRGWVLRFHQGTPTGAG
jgi:hypothetical protein